MLQHTIRAISGLSLYTTRNAIRVTTTTTGPRSIVGRNVTLTNVPLTRRLLHVQPTLYNRNAAVAASVTKEPVVVATATTTETIISKEEPVTVEEVSPEKPKPKRFADLKAIHPLSQQALKSVFRYDTMSTVQEAVLSRLPNTNDMFVKAKTGTGKTLAFLVAALEKVVAGKDKSDLRHFDGSSIFIISPTRELAHQIAQEATKLTKFYPLNVHCFVGGESKFKQIKGLERSRCDIVVGTPGRLNDLLESRQHFRKMVATTQVLVLDEADQLVDMGFKQEVERILSYLPKENRQTLLFSATLSDEIRGSVGKFALSKDYELIDTVGEEDVNTHLHVKQSALVAPYKEQIPLLRNLLQNYEAANEGKTIVFLPTTKSTMAYARLFKLLLPERRVYELHSRKNQNERSRISQQFKRAREGGILFTSDVSARGVDYPGVSLVVQVGVPSSREQYIHRLGRTGRAGNAGEGILVAAPFEDAFIKHEIGDLPVESLIAPEINEDEHEETKRLMGYFKEKMVDEEFTREIYTSYLGYYVGRMQTLRRSREDTLEHAGAFLRGLDIEEIPHLSPRFLQQVGLVEKRRDNSRRGSFNSSFSPRRERRSNDGFFNNRFDDSQSERRDSYRRRDNSSDRYNDRRDNNSERYNNRRDNNSERFNNRRDNNSERYGDRQDNKRYNDRRDKISGSYNDRRRDSNHRGYSRDFNRGGDEQPERKSYKFDRSD
ncbi:P-loop containing nucleoside triphosphate hydrolase protein [Circinella umbellata]|nr:P-loop containing nucleoside triphosphate hydrolase protein [Circinella umbellata]